MIFAYFDTSVLVKNYIREAGSARARELLGRYSLFSSSIAPVELGSALRRRHTQGDLPKQDYSGILARVKRDRAFWDLIEPTPEVLKKAEEIVLNRAVRTLDAVHVASAIILRDSIGYSFPFVSSDGRQLEAARHYGLDMITVDE